MSIVQNENRNVMCYDMITKTLMVKNYKCHINREIVQYLYYSVKEKKNVIGYQD